MIPPIARSFVAGESAATALEHARQLDADGIGAILNLLGEHHDDPATAAADADAYCELLGDVGATDLDACISVKPTQLGLAIDEGLFREQLARIVEAAAETGTFVWLDMENHETTDATLDAFEAHVESYPPMGVCVQANLRRTPADLERLAGLPGKVRLVKGAYDEPAEIAHRDRTRVDEVYRELLASAFRSFEDGIAVASHDPAMLSLAAELHERHGTPYEVQMLMGVREDAQRELASELPVYQYLPYGDRWPSYFYRRIRERKENALFALRAILGR